MMKSFRFWCWIAALLSLATAAAHVFGGGPEFHGPALESQLSTPWKVAFSTVWHEITALLILNGLALICAALALRKNTLVLWFVLLLNAAFALLFFGYGLSRLGTAFILLQWIAFAAMSACIGMAILRRDNLQIVAEVTPSSAAFSTLPMASFADTYVVHGTDFASALAASRGAFGKAPQWISRLLQLRNAIVAPFGLIHDVPPKIATVGMFPILQETKDKVVLGLDDKHLDFRIVVELLNAGKSLSMTTLVKPHHIFGRAYLAVILPFHRLIAATILAQAVADKQNR